MQEALVVRVAPPWGVYKGPLQPPPLLGQHRRCANNGAQPTIWLCTFAVSFRTPSGAKRRR
eukprot:12294454-Alexandrium_andersonii.AAC.1